MVYALKYSCSCLCFSVIAAVKNEHSVDELSTPYKKMLMDQIQQQLSTPTPDSPVNDSTSLDQRADSEDSLNLSYDSALSHRKKAVPCKYVPSDGNLYPCDRCTQSFESQLQYDQHDCVSVPQEPKIPDVQPPSAEHELPKEVPEDEKVCKKEEIPPEGVDDVISAISERAEAVGTTGVKGSAIAQVISGLLVANKLGNNNNTGNSNLSNQTHRQSIST